VSTTGKPEEGDTPGGVGQAGLWYPPMADRHGWPLPQPVVGAGPIKDQVRFCGRVTGRYTSYRILPGTDGSDGSGPVVITRRPSPPPTIIITNAFVAPPTPATAEVAAPAGPSQGTAPLAGTGAWISKELWWALAVLMSGATLIGLTRLGRKTGAP
jgi:hypothetical protein